MRKLQEWHSTSFAAEANALLSALPDPGPDRRQRAILQIGRDRDRFRRAGDHDAAARGRLRRRECRKFRRMGAFVEDGGGDDGPAPGR